MQHGDRHIYVCHAKEIFSTTHPLDLEAAPATTVTPPHRQTPCTAHDKSILRGVFASLASRAMLRPTDHVICFAGRGASVRNTDRDASAAEAPQWHKDTDEGLVSESAFTFEPLMQLFSCVPSMGAAAGIEVSSPRQRNGDTSHFTKKHTPSPSGLRLMQITYKI